MRGVHKLRKHRKAKKLKSGDCIVAFNKASTMARIIDWKGGVHTYYAEPRQVFDLDALKRLVGSGFGVVLEPGITVRRQAEELFAEAA